MHASQLRLEYSCYDVVRVEACADVDPDEGRPAAGPDIDVRVSQLHADDDTQTWAVWLTLSVARAVGPVPPYVIGLGVYGRFAADRALGTDEEIVEVVAVNGASMLYSAARELLLGITARGPNGEYMLPSRDFRALPYRVLDAANVVEPRPRGASR